MEIQWPTKIFLNTKLVFLQRKSSVYQVLIGPIPSKEPEIRKDLLQPYLCAVFFHATLSSHSKIDKELPGILETIELF
jgi:hypothetical protein